VASALQLVVGLGNPGSKYAETRHNAGFWFVDRWAAAHGARFSRESRFEAEAARLDGLPGSCWALKPLTYMNDSGRAVARFMNYYGIAAGSLLVVHDEVDFPPGVVRLKRGGGHGGHNGVADIISAVGPEFLRIRIGVGKAPSRDRGIDHVLTRPSAAERNLIDEAMTRALDVMPLLLAGEVQKAMTALHTEDRQPQAGGR
jgi:PTH1 family peptidyl-tRNA hydrolase